MAQRGEPPTWQALARPGHGPRLLGRVERRRAASDLMRLNQLHRDRARRSGLVVIGIHPPGSEPADVKKVIDALHLEFPVGVDVPAPEVANAWGDLFGRFAVRPIPHAVAVNAGGKVVAHGRLEDVLARNKRADPERPMEQATRLIAASVPWTRMGHPLTQHVAIPDIRVGVAADGHVERLLRGDHQEPILHLVSQSQGLEDTPQVLADGECVGRRGAA